MKRLITSLFQIYESNNPSNPKCTLSQAYSSIRISCDESGARILADFWAELLRPTMPILVEFTYPFHPPPWECHNIDVDNIKREEDIEDVEMISCSVDRHDDGADQDMTIDVDKNMDIDALTARNSNTPSEQLALASAVMTPLPAFDEGAEESSDQWSPPPGKPQTVIDAYSRNGSATAVSLLSSSIPITTGKRQSIKSIYQFKTPSTRMTSGIAGTTLSQSAPVHTHNGSGFTQKLSKTSTLSPSISKVNVGSTLTGSQQTSPSVPFVSALPTLQQTYMTRSTRDASAPPLKRKRKAGSVAIGSSAETRSTDSQRAATQEPSTRSGSQAKDSFKKGTLSHAKTASPQLSVQRHETCTVLVQNALLLDAISAGEHIKIVKTAEGEIIAMRQDDDVETVKRRNSASEIDNSVPDNSQPSIPPSRKRGHDDDMDALIRIWSGGGVPPNKVGKLIQQSYAVIIT